jgi:nitroreductase
MEVMELLLTRRSIRKYTDEKVSDELVKQVVKAAMYAPSAGNQQPWHFVVLRDKIQFKQITNFHPYSQMLLEADVAVLICGDSSLETKHGYWPIDCAAATQNMLLAVHGLGLGAVWLGIYPRHERQTGMSDLLNLPETVIPFSLVVIGYAAEQKPIPERFKEERIHFNKW